MSFDLQTSIIGGEGFNEEEVRDLVQQMREEWKEEDEMNYADRVELEDAQALLQANEEMLDDLNNEFAEFRETTAKDKAEMVEQSKTLLIQIDDLKVQLLDALNKLNVARLESERLLAVTSERFSQKVNQQFDDFMLKVDGELTRRNRLRIETFN